MGIGTSQVRDVLASQCLAVEPLKVRRIDVNGQLRPGVFAKDVILTIIRRLGVQGGVGYAYEYGGSALDRMSMDERMTICNMSIEGGARAGYVNPDDTTFAYLKGRQYVPKGDAFDKAVTWWRGMASDRNASYDDRVTLDAASIEPTVTWGINPGQAVGVSESIPADADAEALAYMGFTAKSPIRGTKIDVAFIGSCTNGRLSDIEEAARIVRGHKVSPHVKALMVPGSRAVAREAEKRGLHQVFIDAGIRVARRRLLDVPRDEPRQAGGTPGLRVVLEPQLQGPARQPDRPHAADEPSDGGSCGDCRRSGGCPHDARGGARMSPQAGPGEKITSVAGRGIPLHGNDIDTDRIMPARFLKVVSFEGLEQHLFEDDRKTNREQHPFSDIRYNEATVLIVNANFGCGSSREHAPQGLVRYGIRAIIGESFSEIFLGNSAVLGLPCFTADHESIEKLQALVEKTPEVTIFANVETGAIVAGPLAFTASVPAALRDAFVSGQWDPTSMLLADFGAVREVAQRLPYVAGF